MKFVKKAFSFMLCSAMLLSTSSAIGLGDCSQSQLALYQEYTAIVEEIAEEYNADITIKPFEIFDFEEAENPTNFRATLTAIAQLTDPEQRYKDNIEYYLETAITRSGNSYTKLCSVTVGSKTIKIKVIGDFVTVYSEAKNGQVFESTTFETRANNVGYTWIPTTSIDSSIDSSTLRTYYVGQDGDVDNGTTIWKNRSIYVEFYLNRLGAIT